jgi:hypothetical protein
MSSPCDGIEVDVHSTISHQLFQKVTMAMLRNSPKDTQTSPQQDRQHAQRLDIMHPQRLPILLALFPLAQDPMPLRMASDGIRVDPPVEVFGQEGSFLFFLWVDVGGGVVTGRRRG